MSLNQQVLNTFCKSLNRVNKENSFFDRFYDHFINEHPEVAIFFQNQDMESIKRKLRMTLERLTDNAADKPGLEMYLHCIAKAHKRYGIKPELFDKWKEALLDTVKEYDPEFNQEINLAWQIVVNYMIDKMHFEVNAA